MKHLKRFNEELTPHKYKKAAKKLREIGHTKRASKLDDWAVIRQEQDDKKRAERALNRWKSSVGDVSKYGTFKWIYGKPIMERKPGGGSKISELLESVIDDFYILLYFNYEELDERLYDLNKWKEKKQIDSTYKTSVSIDIHLLPVKEESAKKMADSQRISTWFGAMFAGWVSFELVFKNDSVDVTKMLVWDHDDGDGVCFLHDRASAGKLKNLIIDIFSGKSDYPSQERGLTLHDQLETDICNQSGLSSDFGLDMEQFLNVAKATNPNTLFREF